MPEIPVIDLFAGPGGLGEGFSSIRANPRFDIRLSIEKDFFAHQTLELRSFVRKFPHGPPADYYLYLKGAISREELMTRHPKQSAHAKVEAWLAELGNEKVPASEVDARITKVLGDHKGKWVLIGGPPCQAYSLVGRSRMRGSIADEETRNNARVKKFEDDHRHYLYRQYLRILAHHQPAVFVLENVKGLLSAKVKEERIVEKIVRDLSRPGDAVPDSPRRGKTVATYRLYPLAHDRDSDESNTDPKAFMIKTEDYGIPQSRQRMILIGVRDDIIGTPGPLIKRQKTYTIEKAIGDLPPLRSGLSKETDDETAWHKAVASATQAAWITDVNVTCELRKAIGKAIRRLKRDVGRGNEFVKGTPKPKIIEAWYRDPELKGFCNHATRGHIRADLHRYLFAAVYGQLNHHSPCLEDLPAHLLPMHKNVSEAIEHGKFNDRFRVQIAGRPSTTITSHISKDGHYFIHYDPTQCRSLTVREAARLQTFPDNYFFEGPRTEQYKQVGNAVPPFLARQIAEIVAELLA
jgi:DNA (cytosine-5)-methyltransferase 1